MATDARPSALPDVSKLFVSEASTPTNADDSEWHDQRLHVIVLSNAGKPLFSLHGDESKLAGLTAVAQALVSVVKDMDGDMLHVVRYACCLLLSRKHQPSRTRAQEVTMVFLERGPLYLVAVGRGRDAQPAILGLILDLVHKQMQMLLTSAMERMVERNPRYDARILLSGTAPLLTSLVAMCRQQPFAALDASPSSPLSPSVRRLLLDHLQIALQQSDTLYALVLAADGTCVAQCRARGTEPLAPRDLLLLSNFVWATESFRAGEEGITPVCLPHANADAFFHAYIRFLDIAQRLPLVLISASPELAGPASEAALLLIETMTSSGMLRALLDAITDTDPDTATPRRQPVMSSDASAPPNWATAGQVPLTSLPAQAGGGTLGTTPLLHFVYRHVATQQAVSSMVDDALMGSLQQEIVSGYLHVRSRLLATRPGVPPHRCFVFRGPQWLLFGQIADAHELYMTCDPLTTLEAATELAARLVSYTKGQLPVLCQQ